ncbi:hypothetical protein L2K70_17365 [Nocardioides KLBMP 9356]|uniref:Secreted protein n=1 Tax=Nocardioides potassii TaxID=2911371 RepID=A0ABS9HGZ1_9ACTN|nr:hypothetical protein [Nocardioides potassii]MCF6379383.1 hypothetical protein [Nocardioides potassii]
MKRMLVATSIAVLALIGVPAAASAAPADAACFGGIHKAINTQGALGLDNVGQLVKEVGGQAKNDAARGLCAAG